MAFCRKLRAQDDLAAKWERACHRKSFGWKILISNSFGCKILRGSIFSASLFSIFCRWIGGGGTSGSMYRMTFNSCRHRGLKIKGAPGGNFLA